MGKRRGEHCFVGPIKRAIRRTESASQRYVREDARTLELPDDRQLSLGLDIGEAVTCCCGHPRAHHREMRGPCYLAHKCGCPAFIRAEGTRHA